LGLATRVCKHCVGISTSILAEGGGNIRKHLAKHRIFEPKKENSPLEIALADENNLPTLCSNQQTIQSYMSSRKVNPHILKRLIVEWIVDRHHSFLEVEATGFRNIIQYCNPVAVNALPKCGDTIRSDTIRAFHDARDEIAMHFVKARSKIHLSFDAWTSTNCKAFLAVVGHWTGEDYTAKTALIAFPKLHGSHTGENIAHVLYAVAKQYKITDNLGWFMSDNASNNDRAIEDLAQQIRDDGSEGFEHEERRLRCFGHTIQLAVKALLFGANVAALEQHYEDPIEAHERQAVKKRKMNAKTNVSIVRQEKKGDEAVEWRKHGAVGKAHNICVFIRRTPQRRETFLEQHLDSLKKNEPALMLVGDNDTRWGSTYAMIKSMLRSKERIEAYINSEPKLLLDRLTTEDWSDLKELSQLLECFDKVTKYAEGNVGTDSRGSIYSVLSGMDFLLNRVRHIEMELASNYPQTIWLESLCGITKLAVN
jgi:hypothetical protein